MAFVKAQTILLCELCETDPKIKWKCIECQLLMCNNCRNRIHPKFKNAGEHQVLDLKEVTPKEVGDELKLDFTKIKCKQHQDQVCCFFCSSCDKLVCSNCILESHNGHEFTDINQAYDLKLEHLKKSNEKFEKDKDNLIKGVEELDNLMSAAEAIGKEVVEQIDDERVILKQEVDRNADNLIKEVEKKLETIEESITGEKIKVEKNIKHLKDQTNMINSILDTYATDLSKFFDDVERIGPTLKERIPQVNLTQKYMPKFVLTGKSHTTVGLFVQNKANTHIQITIAKEFSSEMSHIHHLSICKDNSLCIGDTVCKVIQKVKLDGSSLKPKSTFKTELRGMIVTPTGDVLFGNRESALKMICDGKKKITDSVYSVAPLLIKSLHITHNNKVIVGAHSPCGDQPIFPVIGRRVIIVMDETGKQEEIYENDSNNKRLFSYPDNISTIRTGSIGVVDRLSSDTIGRVVVLLNGDVTGIYTGHSDINKFKDFKPASIVATSSHNFIVGDSCTYTLHIFDSFGHIITYVNTGIDSLHAMAYTESGQLYIGTSPRGSTKAKLYLVDISGC